MSRMSHLAVQLWLGLELIYIDIQRLSLGLGLVKLTSFKLNLSLNKFGSDPILIIICSWWLLIPLLLVFYPQISPAMFFHFWLLDASAGAGCVGEGWCGCLYLLPVLLLLLASFPLFLLSSQDSWNLADLCLLPCSGILLLLVLKSPSDPYCSVPDLLLEQPASLAILY